MRKLSKREIEILRSAAEGNSCKETGRDLGITESTVKVHRKAIIRLLGAKNCTHAVIMALRKGLIGLDNPTGQIATEPLSR